MKIEHEQKLIKFVTSQVGKPFEWGQCDCNIFAMETLDAVYGSDLASEAKGKYSNEQEAIQFRRDEKWDSLGDYLADHGYFRARKGFEQMGDILIVEAPDFEMAHVYLGKRVASVPLGMKVRLTPFSLLKLLDYQVWRKTQ